MYVTARNSCGFFKALSYRFPEEKQENSNSFVEKPGRHLK
jgi:hypothetical protein